jgi:PIN like domain
MGSRKKRSGGRSSTPEPPEPTFFIDRDLCGPRFLEILRRAGIAVRHHNELFDERTADTEWMAFCGERGWVAISGNKAICTTPHEVAAAMESRLRLFVLTSKNRSHEVLAENLVNTWPRLLRFLKRHQAPFIAKISRPDPDEQRRGKAGGIAIYKAYDDWIGRRG